MTASRPKSVSWDFLGSEVSHGSAMDLMESWAEDLRSGKCVDPAFLYLEHSAVVTLGRETLPSHVSTLDRRIPRLPVNRGGQATYHGPGILVGYLVLSLRDRSNGREPDLHQYIRALEAGLMAFVEQNYGLPCVRKSGFTGVWTHGHPERPSRQARKIAAIGIGCRRWVTTHGFALNLHPDLGVFRSFVPCGITDAETSSIENEADLAQRTYPRATMKEVAARVHEHLVQALQAEGWLTEVLDTAAPHSLND